MKALGLLFAFVLAGCATFSGDGGMAPVQQSVKEAIGKDVVAMRTDADREAISKRVADIVAKPLDVDDAVQLAILNNRGLQASFQDLGISESDLVRAGRLPNPSITIGRSSVAGDVGYEQSVGFNVLALLTMPMATEIERRRFEAARRSVVLDILRVAADTRKAYYSALAAGETVRYMRQVRTAAEASAELARRMAEVGNWSALNQAREQSFYADAALQVAQAERSSVRAREQLARLLGVSDRDAYKLPDRLPELPKSAEELPGVEQSAMDRRIDLQMARLDAEAQAKNLGLTRATRFVNVLELGGKREHDHLGDGTSATKRTYEITFELPLFDFGTARVARAEALYMGSVHRAAELAVNARSEVRDAYHAYRTGYDVARHYRDEIVPLHKKISDENLLRYNGMLIGVFDLLADARSQITAVNASIEALRDFWIARADLDMAMIGKPA